MRSIAALGILTWAFGAHAADWRALRSPAEYQATIDLDAVKSQQGLTQFTVRRVYIHAQPHASGKDIHSARVHYLADCKANTVTQVVIQNFGEDRKQVEMRGRKTVKRSELAPPKEGSEVAEALRLACAKAAALPPGDSKALAKPPARSATGTGIVVTREGHVLTNEHVVRQCDSVELVDDLNARYKASVKAVDAPRDLALLTAETRSADVAIFRRDPIPRLGESVTTVGYPLVAVLGTRPSVGFGHVASIVGVRGNPAQMQISVPMQRGASGGPVLDQSGHVIGVVVSKLDALKLAEKLGDLAQNVNFAIRGDTVRAFLEAQRVDFLVSDAGAKLENTELAKRGAQVTVRVRCLRTAGAAADLPAGAK
ncbi:MAG: serine protease [Betaproteobacteria bacterium]|nr:MAG: serine protease [Betaproteobacteria bacterium]